MEDQGPDVGFEVLTAVSMKMAAQKTAIFKDQMLCRLSWDLSCKVFNDLKLYSEGCGLVPSVAMLQERTVDACGIGLKMICLKLKYRNIVTAYLSATNPPSCLNPSK
jgi:hypothetical protein